MDTPPNIAKFIRALQKNKVLVSLPGQDLYENSVATSNLFYRYSRPWCVAHPESKYAVQAVVKEANRNNVTITIKNGGHSYAGFSTPISDIKVGVSLDLRRMNDVEFEKETQTVICDAGALWGNVYKQVVNGRHNKIMINGGRCPTVGVSGFLLGGGLGPFTRSLGMGCDSVKEITLINAEGNLVTVSENSRPNSRDSELFWALRGAGGGSFGVVVELKMRVHTLQAESVVAGKYVWSPDKASDPVEKREEDMKSFMETMNHFYTKEWPDRLTLDSSWICNLEVTTSQLQVRILVYYDGDKKDFQGIIDGSELREDLRNNLTTRIMSEKSTRFLHETLVDMWYEETLRSFPANKGFHLYSAFSFPNTKETVQPLLEVIKDEMKRFRETFPGEKGLMQVTFIHSGGQASKPASDATAFPWRDCVYHAYVTFEWTDKWMEPKMREFLVDFKKQLFSKVFKKDVAMFVNFPDDRLKDEAYEKAYFGDNVQRLREIKKEWDPNDFFNWPQGIKLPSPKLKEAPATPAKMMRPETEFTDSLISERWKTFVPPPASGDPMQPVWVGDGAGPVADVSVKSLSGMGF